MRKNRKRLFAILMTLVIAIMALPTMKVKAAEDLTFDSLTFGETMKVGDMSTFFVNINSASRYDSVDIYFINENNKKIDITNNYDGYNRCNCTLNIPADASLGKYMLVVEGTNSEGNVTTYRDDSWYIYVADSDGNIYSNVMFVFDNQTGLESMAIIKDKIASPKVTIRELLGENCTPEDPELGAFLGWRYNNVLLSVDDKFEVTSDEATFYFYPIFEKTRVNLDIEYIDKDGILKWDNIKGLIVDNNTTYREFLSYLPSETELYSSFSEWVMPSGWQLDDVISDSGVHFRAVYTTYAVIITQTYIAEDGSVKTTEIKKEYPAGTTVQDIIDELPSQSDMSSTYTINGWKNDTGMSEDDFIQDVGNEIHFYAQYADKQIIQYGYSYVESKGEYGLLKYNSDYVLVDKQIAADETLLEEYIKENYFDKIQITHFEKINFDSWDMYIHDYEDDGVYDAINFDAIYTKSQLHLWYNEDDLYVYAIEPGQTVQLPTVINGKYVTWFSFMDDKVYNGTYTVPSDFPIGMQITMEMIVGEDVPVTPPVENPPAENTPVKNPIESPKTGDVNMTDYVCLIGLSGCLILACSKRKKVK